MLHQKTIAKRKAGFRSDQQFAVRIMEHFIIPTFVIRADSKVLIWNKACERLTGVSSADVVGTSLHWSAFYSDRTPCLADLVVTERYAEIQARFSTWDGFGLSDYGVSVNTCMFLPKVGRKVHLAVDCGPIYDETGSLIAAAETLRDITLQRQAHIELESLAALDGLTELANRRSFDLALQREVRRCSEEMGDLSLLMIDVDFFKLFNDLHGHPAGDACLRAVAKTIRAVLRDEDFAARYGGEEFAVILPRTGQEAARSIAERIRSATHDLAITHAGSEISNLVTLSVGVTTGHGGAFDAQQFVNCADQALYQAKRNGRDRCVVAELSSPVTLF